MNRKDLVVVLAATLLLGLQAASARAVVDGGPNSSCNDIGTYYPGLCTNPESEGYNVMNAFPPFGDQKTCRSVCQYNFNLCRNLVKLDDRCIIEEAKTEFAWQTFNCQDEFSGDKTGLKNCLNNLKQEMKFENHFTKCIGIFGNENCAQSFDYCLSLCNNPG